MEKVYHIYAMEECLYNNLNEEQFKNTWNTLKGMVGLLHTDYASEDLSYETVTRHRGYESKECGEPEGCDSY